MAPKGRGTIRRCGFVGVGVALSEGGKKYVTVGAGFEISHARILPSVSADFLSQLSPVTHLPAQHAPCHHDNGLNL